MFVLFFTFQIQHFMGLTQRNQGHRTRFPENLHAYEFKWNASKKVKLTKTFKNAYADATFEVITPLNVHEFLLPPQEGSYF